MAYDLISLKTVKELSLAGAVREALAVGTGEGFAVQFAYGLTTKTLQARRGHPRIFRTLDAAAKLVRSIGLSDMRSHFADWNPATKTDDQAKRRKVALQALDKTMKQTRKVNQDLSAEQAQALADEAVSFARSPALRGKTA